MGNTTAHDVDTYKDKALNITSNFTDDNIDNEKNENEYQMVIDEYLTELYYDPAKAGSFSGVQKLWNEVKADNEYGLTYSDIKEWLNTQDTYKTHKPVKRIFKRESIIMSALDQQWDADIMDMVKFSRKNNGYRYLAIFIDIFSRYIWVRPLRTKKPSEMVNVMKEVFAEGRRPLSIRTDRGSEYIGKEVQTYLKSMEILHFIARNAIHANYAERLIRTLKSKIYRYFTNFQTNKYIDILEDIVIGYQNSIHSTTLLKPIEITSANEQSVYEKIYLPAQVEKERTVVTYKYDVGDYVHTLESRSPFTKGYEETFTQELFEVVYRTPTHPPRYKLIDLKGESIAGTFYEQELQQGYMPDVFRVEKVLKRRVRNKIKEVYVRWQGYPDKFNDWIPEEDVTDLPENIYRKTSKK